MPEYWSSLYRVTSIRPTKCTKSRDPIFSLSTVCLQRQQLPDLLVNKFLHRKVLNNLSDVLLIVGTCLWMLNAGQAAVFIPFKEATSAIRTKSSKTESNTTGKDAAATSWIVLVCTKS